MFTEGALAQAKPGLVPPQISNALPYNTTNIDCRDIPPMAG